jgi:hypothetical protein
LPISIILRLIPNEIPKLKPPSTQRNSSIYGGGGGQPTTADQTCRIWAEKVIVNITVVARLLENLVLIIMGQLLFVNVRKLLLLVQHTFITIEQGVIPSLSLSGFYDY